MFRVEWLQSALNELAAIWSAAPSADRQAITTASHTLDARLQHDPHNEEKSRGGARRFTFIPPLAVTFQMEADGQRVTVLHVRMYRRRR
jgi:plasmid stabilization system protein ParE